MRLDEQRALPPESRDNILAHLRHQGIGMMLTVSDQEFLFNEVTIRQEELDHLVTATSRWMMFSDMKREELEGEIKRLRGRLKRYRRRRMWR